MISVVVPAFNAVGTIAEQLSALASQSYSGEWEVVVADNGSTDATAAIIRLFSERLPNLRYVDASRGAGASAARNIGAHHARGDLLLFCDADDRVSSTWLEHMAEALATHTFVAGAMDHDSLNAVPTDAWHWRSHVSSAPLGFRFKPYALSSNMGVSRQAFEDVGGFPETPTGVGEDVAVSWLLQMEGHPLHFEPKAVVAYRHRQGLRALWRQQAAYAYNEPWLFRRFREAGMPRPPQLGALRAYLLLIIRLHWLLGRESRARWIRMLARRWGRLRGSLRFRVLYL